VKAVVFLSKNEPLKIAEIARPDPKADEVLIQLNYAALNHLDFNP
jgi:Zn-dependent alcohol dehydrogenase